MLKELIKIHIILLNGKKNSFDLFFYIKRLMNKCFERMLVEKLVGKIVFYNCMVFYITASIRLARIHRF